MVEAGELSGEEVERTVREGLAPLLGERDASGDFVFPLPASARVDTLLLGCTHYPLIRHAEVPHQLRGYAEQAVRVCPRLALRLLRAES